MSESAERWRALEELFQAALEQEPAARDAFLEQACADADLRRQVRTLLNAQAAGDALLDKPAAAYVEQPLESGALVGQYRIEERIGAGGMGEVYRATDPRLRRAVAIKVLPAIYASDPEFLARFEREARLLAQFNHPYIGAIYGVEEGALIMELVEGPTLAERIAQGPIPLDDALPVIRQIAEAIDYAHARGVIHRDLKPANIKFTAASGGRVKVLDFGIAKALESSSTVGGNVSTRSSKHSLNLPATLAGAIKGTPAYMSPEQARGELVDQRADLWALGAVIYEMLKGQALFERRTIEGTLAAVKESPVDLAGFEPRVRRVLEHCLDRELRTRWRSAGNVALLLEEARARPAARQSMAAWIVALVFGLIAIMALFGWWRASH
jgi:serine/threonine-protein kinase